MWLFTSKGFISAVKHRNKAGHFMVRARVAEHLRAIFPGEEVQEIASSDYKYRITVDSVALKRVMLEQIDSIRYDNFKDSIPDHKYHDACSRVWREMHKIQPGSPYADRITNEVNDQDYMQRRIDDLTNDEETTRCDQCDIELPQGEICLDCNLN
jgi:hypothetical protein